ncbi:MAG: protein kinase [Anaerolineae bacterium]|nr:protein kinase [Anaerolineae bacterium]
MSASPQFVTFETENKTYFFVQEHTLIGKIIGNRYRVLRELGSGGMAWVYLAEDVKNDYLVAVKVLYPQFGEDLSYIQRFNREAKLASTLTDPHIVRVLDYGADRDIYYLVMEYIEGQDLREILKEKGPFFWRNSLDLLDQLATALEHAHLHEVVHRDIKPQNLMIEDDSGLLKVLDFGIARVPTLPSLTQSGFVGSPYYVSPEQAMGEEVDIRSDIYSSGIVLYELLSGNIPFDAKSPWSIISQHISSEPPPIKLPDDNVPQGIHQLIERMVTKRPEDRFQTPTSLRRAVAAVLAGQPIPDDTLDTRLVIAAEQEVKMAESLYQRALEAIDGQEWARAVDLLTQVIELDPGNSEASKRLIGAKQEAILISLYSATKRAIKAGNWEDVVNNLNGIVEINPVYKDAQELLAQARQALERENRQQFIMTRYNEGVAHFEAGRWTDAVEAFQEVQRLSPGYQRVEQLLAEIEQLRNLSWFQKLRQAIPRSLWWRWGLVALGAVAIMAVFFLGGNDNGVAGDDSSAEQLRELYTEARLAVENNNVEQAITLLDEILLQNPDYADAADLRRELVISLTPTPTATPLPSPTPIPTQDPVIALLSEAQEAIELEQWSDAIDALQAIRSAGPEFEKARIASLFCDAYVGRGLETLAGIRQQGSNPKEIVGAALADFEAGTAECPRRIDLQDQAERASAYLEALNTPTYKYDLRIQILSGVVAAEPYYADGNAKKLLYAAYLRRGDVRQLAGEIVGALGDYEAALALNVEDPSKAQSRRAELLLSFNQQPLQPTAPATPVQTRTVTSGDAGQTASARATPEPVRIRLGQPILISPENDVTFAGRLFEEAILEWEPMAGLAANEYYDLTLMYIYADQPKYWGLATKDTRVKLIADDIGVGQAGGDRFYWWVTVRKAYSAPSPDSIDLPVSLRSEARTFVWTP